MTPKPDLLAEFYLPDELWEPLDDVAHFAKIEEEEPEDDNDEEPEDDNDEELEDDDGEEDDLTGMQLSARYYHAWMLRVSLLFQFVWNFSEQLWTKKQGHTELNPIMDASRNSCYTSECHPKFSNFRKLRKGVLVDSGAGASVFDSDGLPGCQRSESAGSRRGQKFMGPGGETIDNRGQVTVPIITSEGIRSDMKFQDARVRRPILAVKDSCRAGNICLFDNDASVIMPRNSPEGRSIRELIKRAKTKVSLEELDGVYVLPAWVGFPDEKHSHEKPQPQNALFQRRGGVPGPKLQAPRFERATRKSGSDIES